MNNTLPLKVIKSIVVDRSGSMISMGDKPTEMTYKILRETYDQSIDDNVDTSISLTSFDDIIETIIKNEKISLDNIPSIENIRHFIRPRNTTKFRDTLINDLDNLMDEKDKYLKSLSRMVRNLDPCISMISIIITDGQDNCSFNTIEQCKNKVKEFRENGGQIIFMGANIDTSTIGEMYGMDTNTCLDVHNSDPDAIESGFNAIISTQRQMSSGCTNVQFSQMQRSLSYGITQLQPPNHIPSNLNHLSLNNNTISNNNIPFNYLQPLSCPFNDDF
jgi:hypothetical protein